MEAQAHRKLLSAEEACAILGVSLRSLVDKRYRRRIGLPCIKIGRRIMFDSSEVEKLIQKNREQL